MPDLFLMTAKNFKKCSFRRSKQHDKRSSKLSLYPYTFSLIPDDPHTQRITNHVPRCAVCVCGVQSGTNAAVPEGEIVGQSVDLGHIIRTGQAFEVPATNWQAVNTAVIGAGVAGLTAAWKFKRESFNDFVVLELEKVAGGTARSGQGEPVGYPWGARLSAGAVS